MAAQPGRVPPEDKSRASQPRSPAGNPNPATDTVTKAAKKGMGSTGAPPNERKDFWKQRDVVILQGVGLFAAGAAGIVVGSLSLVSFGLPLIILGGVLAAIALQRVYKAGQRNENAQVPSSRQPPSSRAVRPTPSSASSRSAHPMNKEKALQVAEKQALQEFVDLRKQRKTFAGDRIWEAETTFLREKNLVDSNGACEESDALMEYIIEKLALDWNRGFFVEVKDGKRELFTNRDAVQKMQELEGNWSKDAQVAIARPKVLALYHTLIENGVDRKEALRILLCCSQASNCDYTELLREVFMKSGSNRLREFDQDFAPYRSFDNPYPPAQRVTIQIPKENKSKWALHLEFLCFLLNQLDGASLAPGTRGWSKACKVYKFVNKLAIGPERSQENEEAYLEPLEAETENSEPLFGFMEELGIVRKAPGVLHNPSG